MKFTKSVTSVLTLALVSMTGLAHEVYAQTAPTEASDPAYYQVSKPELVEIADPDFLGSWRFTFMNDLLQSSPLSYAATVPMASGVGTSTASGLPIDEIIAVGKLIWNIIEKNQPKVDTKANRLSVIPKLAADWTDLERWSNPESRVFKISYKNGFGSEVVRFSFRVVYLFGGRFNGKGKYLGNVSVIPMDTYVAWGYTLNSRAEFPIVVNVGTLADPVAAAQLDITWEVETVMKKSRESASYFVRGDGQIIDLTYGF